MSVRQIMKMRAVLQRDNGGTDPYGHKSPALWTTIDSDLPCHVWESKDRKTNGVIIIGTGGPMMVLPKSTDITIDDRFLSIKDRAGNEIYGMMYIDGSIIKRKDYKELRLKKIA